MAKLHNGPSGKERRKSPRLQASKVVPHGIMRLASGQEVELINLNVDGGLCIKSSIMLKPGSYVRLRLDIPGASATMGGCVQRCRIASIEHDVIQFEAAIILDEKFSLPLNEELQKSSDEPIVASLSFGEIKPGNKATHNAAH